MLVRLLHFGISWSPHHTPQIHIFFHATHETLFMFLLTVNDSLFLEEREILGYERNP